jgi:hypothetical protein
MEFEHTGVVLHQLGSYLHRRERARGADEPGLVRMHRPLDRSFKICSRYGNPTAHQEAA